MWKVLGGRAGLVHRLDLAFAVAQLGQDFACVFADAGRARPNPGIQAGKNGMGSPGSDRRRPFRRRPPRRRRRRRPADRRPRRRASGTPPRPGRPRRAAGRSRRRAGRRMRPPARRPTRGRWRAAPCRWRSADRRSRSGRPATPGTSASRRSRRAGCARTSGRRRSEVVGHRVDRVVARTDRGDAAQLQLHRQVRAPEVDAGGEQRGLHHAGRRRSARAHRAPPGSPRRWPARCSGRPCPSVRMKGSVPLGAVM